MTIFWLVLLFGSFLIITILFLRKLGAVNRLPQVLPDSRLWPYLRQRTSKLGTKIWHFILEAKDLKPVTGKVLHHQVEKVRSIFRVRIRSSSEEPQWLPEAAELTGVTASNLSQEERYLEAIKR